MLISISGINDESKSPELAEGHISLVFTSFYYKTSIINSVYTVYILRNLKNHLYIGCTSNLSKRLSRHNAGDGAEFTKRHKDFTLVYEETFATLLEARRREKQIKGWTREKKENLIKFGKPIIT